MAEKREKPQKHISHDDFEQNVIQLSAEVPKLNVKERLRRNLLVFVSHQRVCCFITVHPCEAL